MKRSSGRTPREPRDSRGLTAEDRRIWGRVASSVTPARPKKAPRIGVDAAHVTILEGLIDAPSRKGRTPPKRPAAPAAPAKPSPPRFIAAPEDLEPNRKKRLTRERDPIEARIDLHGFGRFEAEDQLRAFLASCQAREMRSVLVITGQGRLGGGVIRASFADWMHSPALRGIVSGYSGAARRHGGDGAFYVTLKRKG